MTEETRAGGREGVEALNAKKREAEKETEAKGRRGQAGRAASRAAGRAARRAAGRAADRAASRAARATRP